ncbi:MAG: hypothetical protein FJ399_11755 [Verrucomicrobia bacterium]|nr:hypothetical protein [Verrucomicrobiota bacterium]
MRGDLIVQARDGAAAHVAGVPYGVEVIHRIGVHSGAGSQADLGWEYGCIRFGSVRCWVKSKGEGKGG